MVAVHEQESPSPGLEAGPASASRRGASAAKPERTVRLYYPPAGRCTLGESVLLESASLSEAAQARSSCFERVAAERFETVLSVLSDIFLRDEAALFADREPQSRLARTFHINAERDRRLFVQRLHALAAFNELSRSGVDEALSAIRQDPVIKDALMVAGTQLERRPYLRFHDAERTWDVLSMSLLLALSEGKNPRELLVVGLTAVFENLGYLQQYERHEQAAAEIARRALSDMNDWRLRMRRNGASDARYTPSEIETVGRIILDTEIRPHRATGRAIPSDLDISQGAASCPLSAYVMDAGLSFWAADHEYFLERSALLRAERREQRSGRPSRALPLDLLIELPHRDRDGALRVESEPGARADVDALRLSMRAHSFRSEAGRELLNERKEANAEALLHLLMLGVEL